MLICCPHCKSRLMIRTSGQLGDTVRVVHVQCPNLEHCAWTGKAYISIVETFAPSMTPNPTVNIPLSPRAKAAQPDPSAQGSLSLVGGSGVRT